MIRNRLRTLMMGLMVSTLLAVAALSQAVAAPMISSGSELNITGLNVTSITSTEVIFAGNASVGALSGDFTAFGTCVSCAVMTSPLVYSPFTPGVVYIATNGAEVTSFSITSQLAAPVFSSVGGVNTITIDDAGTASLTGFDPTPGIWVFTGNSITGLTGSFSATAAAVSEPGSLLILLVGFVGLVYFARRRTSDNSGAAFA